MLDVDNFIFIGQIVKPFSNEGWCLVDSWSFFADRFWDFDNLFLTKPGSLGMKVMIEDITYKDQRLCIKFKGVNNRQDAFRFSGFRITIPKDQRAVLPTGYYYYDQLIGCRVVDKNYGEIGQIVDILDNNKDNIYVVNYNEKRVLIPAIDEFVKHRDIFNKLIEVELIPGFLSDEN